MDGFLSIFSGCRGIADRGEILIDDGGKDVVPLIGTIRSI
jgi:hypothetical protein